MRLLRLRAAFGDGRLAGARVYLRPARLSDYASWAELRARSRGFLLPWEPVWPDDALSRGVFRRRLRADARERRNGAGYGYLIFRQGDDAMLGGIGLSAVRRGVAQTAAVGYWIGEPYARCGFMTDALHTLLGFAFRALELHRIEAACLRENIASRRLLARLGFREEGFARQYLRINGGWADHLLFALLAEEFAAGSSVAGRTREQHGIHA